MVYVVMFLCVLTHSRIWYRCACFYFTVSCFVTINYILYNVYICVGASNEGRMAYKELSTVPGVY